MRVRQHLPDHGRPGVVLVGADDAGNPTGLEITDRLLLQLSEDRRQHRPAADRDRRQARARQPGGAVVTVRPADSRPVRYRGRTWIRVGPRRAIASAQDERILNEKRRYRDPHYDSFPVRTATVDDLRVGRFMDEYLPAAVDAETLAANDRTAEERLAAAKMIVSVDEPVPTVAGVLVLGRRPQHFLRARMSSFCASPAGSGAARWWTRRAAKGRWRI